MQAALITMLIKSEYETLKTIIDSPAQLLEMLNATFFSKYSNLNTFFTCCILDINTKQKEFIFSSAGHPSQVFISEGKIVELERTGKLIGFAKKSTYFETKFPYSSGDKLFLFSDGLFEEMNNKNELFGEDKIRKIIQQHESASISFIMNLILQELDTHLANRLVQDDITFLGVQLS